MQAAVNAMGIWEGQVLDGKYQVERVLGVGGMGIVVAARHLQLEERVAIKLLHAHTLSHPKTVSRFAREARAAAKIKSEHAAYVSDVGTLENGIPYMVMEYLEGEDLSTWLRQRGALAWSLAIEFVLQACEALAVAHSAGIVHRDLKPANLFVTRRMDGSYCLKVLDFGISRVESDVSMTQTAQVLGSPLYMSPEQLGSPESVDARSDIWSLGIILFELMTGAPPFNGDTLPELVGRVLTQTPPPLLPQRAEDPSAVDSIVRRCLEKDRNQRFASVADLAYALVPFAPASAHISVERIANILRPAFTDPALSAPYPRTPLEISRPATLIDPVRSSRAPVFVLLGISLFGLILVAAFLLRGSPEHVTTPPQPSTPLGAQPPPKAAPVPVAPVPVAPVPVAPVATLTSTSAAVAVAPSAAPARSTSTAPSPRPQKAAGRTGKPAAPESGPKSAPTYDSAPAAPPPPPPPPEPPLDPFENRK